jgi:hypothetical protein
VLLDKAYEAKKIQSLSVIVSPSHSVKLDKSSGKYRRGDRRLQATMEMGILLKAWKLGSVTARRHKREAAYHFLTFYLSASVNYNLSVSILRMMNANCLTHSAVSSTSTL